VQSRKQLICYMHISISLALPSVEKRVSDSRGGKYWVITWFWIWYRRAYTFFRQAV